MPTSFPTSVDSFTNPTSTDTLDNPSHSDQHADINDAMEAVQDYVLEKVRYVPMATPQDLVFNTFTADVAQTTLSATNLPTTGVVAVTGTVTNVVNDSSHPTVTIYHYNGGQILELVALVQSSNSVATFIAGTGGTSNRQFKYASNWISGTQTVRITVTGYFTTDASA